MSQAVNGRTESLRINSPIAPQPVWVSRRAWWLRVTGLQRLLAGLVLICAVAPAALAQQAQVVNSAQPIVCDGKNYQLRLVTAEAPINTKNAKVLAIVLTPEGETDSKVFGLYWIDAQAPSPTHRDNTTGALKKALMPYGQGLDGEKVPVVESFFKSSRCSPDAQVNGVQNLLGSIRLAPGLREVAQQLKNMNVGVDEAQVTDASAEELVLFKGLPNEIGFASAVRLYVSALLAAGGRKDDAGNKPSLEDANKALVSRNQVLEKEAQERQAEKALFFSGAPTWLLTTFAITLVLLLLAIGRIVITYPIDKDPLLENNAAAGTKTAGPRTEGPNGPAVQVSNKLAEIITSASARAQSIEQKAVGANQTSTTQNQKAKPQTKLVDKILYGLGPIVRQQQFEQARRKLTEVLDAVATDAESHDGEWHQAHTKLQSQLEEFRKSLLDNRDTTPAQNVLPHGPTPQISSPDKKEAPIVVQQMTEALNKLATDVGTMKSSVAGFEGTLAKSLEANRVVQNIWWQWYGKDYAGQRTDTLVTELGEVINLYRFLRSKCCKDGTSVEVTKKNLGYALADLEYIRKTYLSTWLGDTSLLHDITNRLKTKLADEAEILDKYKTIETLLRKHFGNDRKATESVPRLIAEQSEAQQKLRKYYPNQDFVGTIDAVVASYVATTGEVNRALPAARGTMLEMVTSLATEYLTQKPEAEKSQRLEAEHEVLQRMLTTARMELKAGKDLVEEIAVQLNFKTGNVTEDEEAISTALNKLIKERESSVYLQLRMGLSSALTALAKATSTGGSAEQADVIEALQIEKVKKGITKLLAEMEDCSGEQLWSRGLSEGFSQKWLHYLIRADLLLRTYYSHQRDFGFLQQAVSLACSALLAALYELNVEVIDVGLFEPLPGEMETEPVYPGIRNLPAVRDKVRLKLQNIQTGEVVVDVTSFPYFVKGIQANRGRASLANPSAWLQH